MRRRQSVAHLTVTNLAGEEARRIIIKARRQAVDRRGRELMVRQSELRRFLWCASYDRYLQVMAQSAIDKIPSGPKLDALTAGKVFGWKNVHKHQG
jgi:hypothetical protein